ncbi:MAG: transcriptional repressor [Pseudomonadota bacterium]
MGQRGDELRAEVVRVLRLSDGPRSAYDILKVLQTSNPKTAPTTVYRTLNGLMEVGLVHRLESLNAYVLSQTDDPDHQAILSICNDCGIVEETVAPEVLKTMVEAVGESGFAPSRHVIEVHGTCVDCSPDKQTS